MPQTIEAINHAKAAPHVTIMVAVNKMDLPGANLDRVKQQLQEHELTPEDWGGDTIVVPVSATKGTGIDELLENMVVQAEMMELKASPTATPRGTVIEAQVEAGPRTDRDGHRADGHAQSGRAVHLRRLRRQSEVAGRRSRQADQVGRALDAGEGSWVSPDCRMPATNSSSWNRRNRPRLLSEERLAAEAHREAEHAAARHAREPARSRRRQESFAPRPEVRRAGFARSAGGVVRPDREQEDRSRDDSLRGRPDFRVRHPARERVERGRRRLQHQGREQRRRRRQARRRAGQTLQHHLRADRPDEGSDGRACSIRNIARPSSATPK